MVVKTAEQQPAERLCAEILAEAGRQRAAVLQRAQAEAESLIHHATTAATADRARRLREAQCEVEQRTAVIEATYTIEAGRMRAERFEEVLSSLRDEVARRLLARSGFDYRLTLLHLAREAMAGIKADSLVIRLSPIDAAKLGEELIATLRAQSGGMVACVKVEVDADLRDGGLVMLDAESRQLWDDQFPARLARLWPELRRQIVGLPGLSALGNPMGGGQ